MDGFAILGDAFRQKEVQELIIVVIQWDILLNLYVSVEYPSTVLGVESEVLLFILGHVPNAPQIDEMLLDVLEVLEIQLSSILSLVTIDSQTDFQVND